MIKRSAHKHILSLALLGALAMGISGCSKKDGDSASSTGNEVADVGIDKTTLRYPLRDDVKSLDPAIAFDAVSLRVMPNVMESLFQYTYYKTPLTLEPLLAEAMPTVSKDGKVYTIKIKKGVMFHDNPAFPNGKGRELVAEDFIYGWKRLLHPELASPGTWIFEDKVVGYTQLKQNIMNDKSKTADQHIAEAIPGFKALDSHTIQITLEKPYAQLGYVLAMGFGAPVAKEVVEKYGQLSLGEHVVGTGPYMVKEIIHGSKITIVKNPTFRKEVFPSEGDADAKARGLLADAGKALPFIDKVEFHIVKEDSPMWLQFNKAALDITEIPKDSFDGAIVDGKLTKEYSEKGVKLEIAVSPVIWYLNFNMKDPLVGKNVNLRRAIVRAVDRDFMIKTFWNGRAKKGGSLIPPGVEGHADYPIVGDYNVAEAKEYLKRAGYPDGANLPEIRLDLRGAQTSVRQQGDYLKKALSEIGVKVNVIANTFPAYLEKEKTGNLQFFIGGWGADYPDPENFLQLLYSKNVAPGPNASNWQNPKFDELYLKTANMKAGPAKDKLLRQAEKIVFDDAVWSMLYYRSYYYLDHAWVSNYRPHELINNDFKYMKIDPEKRKTLLSQKF